MQPDDLPFLTDTQSEKLPPHVDEKLRKLRFLNYVPRSEVLKKCKYSCVAAPCHFRKLQKSHRLTMLSNPLRNLYTSLSSQCYYICLLQDCEEADEPDALLKEITQDQEDMFRLTNGKFMDPSLDLDNLIPKKGNTDMKRVLTSKLLRLQRRTRKTIIEIARKKQQEDGNLTGLQTNDQQLSSDEE